MKKPSVSSRLAYLLVGLLLFGLAWQNLSAQDEILPYQELILEGQSLTFNEKYTQAQEKFQALIEKMPENPAGYFYLAMVYQAQMKDLESDLYQKEFHQNLNKVIELTKPKEEKKTANKWDLLFLGNAYGSLGYYQAKHGGWFSGFKLAKKAKGVLEKALQQDSSFYEAYFGLGSYHYWRSIATKIFNWIPFIGDKREKGIKLLQIASERAVFFREPAQVALIWIYFKEKRYSEALELVSTLQGKYPEFKVPFWAKAFIYYERYDWRNCLTVLDELEERILQTQKDNFYNLIEVNFLKANCHYNLGHEKICQKICQEILANPLDEKIKERQKEKLDKTKKLLKKCQK
ncbi:MAG: hypothetical protein A2145_05280 [candidate division Zixibacteria bacterium RBG_16_40_9]|nr:MAG: hypothetical protein A2145_05280 [candidate division Zixibacteria bacterium RBG_16_40_9]